MKKLLFLFLLTFTTISYSQTTLANKLKITANITDNTASKVNVQSTDGTINTISKSDLVNVLEVNDVPTLPLVGEVGKIYVVKNVNKIYRWNGTFYQELAGSDINYQSIIDALTFTPENVANKVTSIGSSANDTNYPSELAVKTYADNLVIGMLNDRGAWDASVNVFPATGGSGVGGAIRKGDMWYVSVAGTLGTKSVNVGDSFRALINAPSQVAADWSVLEANIGYVPANDSNVVHLAGAETITGQKTFNDISAVTNYKSSTSNVVISDTDGAVFRGVRSGAWSDSVNSRFFQVGNPNDNVVFTTRLGSAANRMLFSSLKTQFSSAHFGATIVPRGVFEITNGTNRFFNVFESGNSVFGGSTDDLTNRLQVTGTVSSGTTALGNTPPTANNQLTRKDYVDSGLALKTLGYFNVKEFGAVGDNITDDTAAIQAAINAAYDDNGGTVYFPNGIYKIAGALQGSATGLANLNSQLYIKNTRTNFVTIKILGETPPTQIAGVLGSYAVNTGGVILNSTIQGTNLYPSILSSVGLVGNGYANGLTLDIENIEFRVKANTGATGPNMSALNAMNILNTNVNSCFVGLDISTNLSVYPTNETFGFYMPRANQGQSSINNTAVTGLKYGYVFSEHNMGDLITAVGCEYAFVFANSYHPNSFNRMNSAWCKYSVARGVGSIYDTGLTQSSVNITQLDIEWQPTSYGNWFDTSFILVDVANQFKGHIEYQMVRREFGIDNTGFSKNGGSNIQTIALGVNHLPLTGGDITGGVNATNGFSSTSNTGSGVTTRLHLSNTNPNNGSGTSIVLGSSATEGNGNARIVGTAFSGNDYRSQIQLQTTTTAGVWNSGIKVNENNVVTIGGLSGTGTRNVVADASGNLSTDSTVYAPLASPALTGVPTAPTATAGTNTTQIATTAFVQANSRPYKVYTALLSQSGTSAPVATVLENTLGGTVVWSRAGAGIYNGTLYGAFTTDKTQTFSTANLTGVLITAGATSTNIIGLNTQSSSTGVLTDGFLNKTSIEIRVYL